MRIAVFGAGAVGTWMGADLAAAGHDVTLVARGAQLDALVRDGARLLGPDGEERCVPVAATADPAEIGPVDTVVLAAKAHQLADVAATIGPLLGPDTTLVAAQNGIPWWYFHAIGDARAGRRVQAVDPGGVVSAGLAPERVLGAVIYLGASLPRPGTVAIRPEDGLVLGEPDGSASPRLAAAADAFTSAGFPVRCTEDIRTALWVKLMGNAAFNLVSVLTRAGGASMAGDPHVGTVLARIMEETVAIAEAVGARPQISVAERLAIAARLGDHRSSTLQDLDAGKRLELDALGAAVVELADVGAVAAPTLRTVFALAALQARSLGLR